MFGGCFYGSRFCHLSYTCGRCVPIASNSNSKELEINEQIRDKEIRLIGADGAQMGIMSPRDALRMAIDKDLDLVKVAPQAKPPVCKILDYGKHRFQEQKKKAEARKRQKVVELKEIKLRPNIDTHDYDVKAKAMHRFFDDGDKVKVTIRFRGREMAHPELGMKLMIKVQADFEEEAKVEFAPKMEGRQMIMIIAPARKKP